mmetsp:Transcript_1183/g.2779  ORF Transcript_1183/g.2779 Transcript_1183/m.2779 type:complete len:213 (+) Transcript_1183:164-802(+)
MGGGKFPCALLIAGLALAAAGGACGHTVVGGASQNAAAASHSSAKLCAFALAPLMGGPLLLRNGKLGNVNRAAPPAEGPSGLRMGFAGDHLVTYGDAFRQVETLESSLGMVEAAVEGTGSKPSADLGEGEEDKGKRMGVVSKIGSGVVSALNRVLAGPDSEEVRQNLEAFARSHPGIGLAIEARPTKRVSDIDRLEKCLEKALGVNDIEDAV